MKKIEFKKLDKLPSRFYAKPAGADIGLACIIDTETTGLDHVKDEVIELGYVVVEYDKKTGALYGIVDQKDYLQAQKKPLADEIKAITGLTDKDLKGNFIPWDIVGQDLKNVNFFVAHNAGFDRPMLEKYHAMFRQKPWADSMTQIDWLGKTHMAKISQETLCLHVGKFLYDSHRALNDAQALTQLLSGKDSEGVGLFKSLLDAARGPYYMIYATGAPYDTKDILRENGYRWNPDRRVWQKVLVDASKKDVEVEWLKKNITASPAVENVGPLDRFRK